MQKGFATIEIILVTLIIAVLVKVAVPKAAQLIDNATLDYENKRLYSELRYVQAMSRSNEIQSTGTGNTSLLTTTAEQPTLFIDTTKNYYQVFRSPELKKILREPHYLSNGIKISSPENNIKFNSNGNANINSGSITLTSRLGKKKYIIFNTVGRIRGSLTRTGIEDN